MKQRGGFSFIEGMMAAVIVTIGMIAVIQLMTANLLTTFNARNDIAADFLAQEGMEIVRNMRDNNWAQNQAAFAGPFPPNSATNCRVDFASSSLLCSGASKTLNLDSATGKYSYAGGASSRFQREIVIKYDTNSAATAASAQVTSVVVWGGSLPAAPVSASNCKQVNQCTFVTSVLNNWGGS